MDIFHDMEIFLEMKANIIHYYIMQPLIEEKIYTANNLIYTLMHFINSWWSQTKGLIMSHIEPMTP